jgi:hypothetical protein
LLLKEEAWLTGTERAQDAFTLVLQSVVRLHVFALIEVVHQRDDEHHGGHDEPRHERRRLRRGLDPSAQLERI